MEKVSLNIGNLNGEALFLKAQSPSRTVLFAAGGGGNPERHLPLLNFLNESGCTVIAPYFERIVSPRPSANELQLRTDLLRAALNIVGDLNLPIIGIGHSIGATLLLGLAGGQMWMYGGQRFPTTHDERLKKLVLFTPATDFFKGPDALEKVHASIQAWAGALDTLTPPAQVEFLKNELPNLGHFELRLVAEAGHFSFMNTLPPNITDSIKDREKFLSNLATEVCNFVMK